MRAVTIVVIVLIVFYVIVAGMTFRAATGASFTECVFAHADCSTAAATWTVAFVTGAAFFAAYQAYVLEVQPALGVALCANDEHKKPKLAVFIDRDNVSIRNVPPGYGQDDFAALAFDFENLGRSSLVGVWTELLLNDHGAGGVAQTRHRLDVGNIAPQQSAHVILYLLRDPPWPTIAWSAWAHRRGGAFSYEALLRYRLAAARRRGRRPSAATLYRQRHPSPEVEPWRVTTEPRESR
jgi:hypothetical protein